MPFRRCLSAAGVATLLGRSGFQVEDIHGRELSSVRPVGYARAWTMTRPARSVAYGTASTLLRVPVHPWLDVLASPSPPPSTARESRGHSSLGETEMIESQSTECW